MVRELAGLAVQGIRRKKKTSIPAFCVLLVSFSFLVFAISFVSSIAKTNDEFRIETYGEWYLALSNADAADMKWLSDRDWTEAVGRMDCYGSVNCGDKETGFGTIDQNLIEIGRLKLNDGRWPETDNEVAMEADTLNALGSLVSFCPEIPSSM